MNKSVAFFTEGAWVGKFPRDSRNARSDVSWYAALNADHHSIFGIEAIRNKYDIGILTIPKNNVELLKSYSLIDQARKVCDKVLIMQEANHQYFQDYTLEQQIWYYNILMSCDMILCHNQYDYRYYKGLTENEVSIMPVFMLENTIQDIQIPHNRDGVMIGGNFCSWYSGFDSMIVAQQFETDIYAPSMGRKIEREEELDIIHLPYLQWSDWIRELNKVKYGVHLMRTFAAGTFAMNCAYLAIPCIGYEELDTQIDCHSNTSVEVGDIVEAKNIAKRLREDVDFYEFCSKLAKEKYEEYHTEKKFVLTFDSIIERLYG